MLERSQEELAAIRQGDYPPVKTTVENFDDYEQGGEIWVSLRREGDHLIFEVRDNGKGMSQETCRDLLRDRNSFL